MAKKNEVKVEYKRGYETLKIYINNQLHVLLKTQDLIGFQSWIHGEAEYFIEYYFSTGAKINTVYGRRDIWSIVLEVLDKSLKIG